MGHEAINWPCVFVGIDSKHWPNLLQHAMHIAIFSLNSLAMFLVKFSFWNKVSCNINHTIRILWYQRINMPRYFFQINCLYFLSFGRNSSVFKNQDFTPKFSGVQKCIFFGNYEQNEESSYIWSWSKFRNTVWSVDQDMGWRTQFLHMAANYRLKTLKFIHLLFVRDDLYHLNICYLFSFQTPFEEQGIFVDVIDVKLHICHIFVFISPTYKQNIGICMYWQWKLTAEARVLSERTEVCMFGSDKYSFWWSFGRTNIFISVFAKFIFFFLNY